MAFVFLFLFPIVVTDVVVGLGLRFGCDFGGWGLRLWVVVVVTMAVVVVAMVVVEWVVGFFFFFFDDGGCWWLAVGVWMWVLLG